MFMILAVVQLLPNISKPSLVWKCRVFNREYNIMMDREFNLVASSGYLANKRTANTVSSSINNIDGAFGDASSSINAACKANNGQYQKFAVSNSSSEQQLVGEPRAKKVFFERKGKLFAAHYVEIETSSIDSVDSDYFSYVIAAKTGEVLFKKYLTSHAADFDYRVMPTKMVNRETVLMAMLFQQQKTLILRLITSS